MTNKLILSIKAETIEKAKQVSIKRGKSLSKIVEEYLEDISNEETDSSALENILKITRKYKNKIELPEDGNYNRMANEMRYADYIKDISKQDDLLNK